MTAPAAHPRHPQSSGTKIRLPVTKLPFVGERTDGRVGYWVLPEMPDGADLRLQARTFAAWFMLYAEVNGRDASQELLDRIELEMPSRHPLIDRTFLQEIARFNATDAA